jgi:class 3 adenylate cyclase
MSISEVIDTSGTKTGLSRRRAWIRIGMPIGGVALVIIAILAIALYSERTNRAGVLALSDDMLDILQSRISLEVTSYLQPAIRATRLVRDIVARKTVVDHAAVESFAWSALRQIPQVDALYSGDSDGNFVMVQRDEGTGTRTKLVRNTPGPRLVEWTQDDADGRVTRRDEDPNDPYDPRTRDWYQGALKSDDVFWTSLYVFYTHQEPGITAAIRYRGEDGADHVFGVDITLKALSGFLASLQIRRSGRAVIIDDAGHLIAAPEALGLTNERGGQYAAARPDELNDPVMASVYDHFRIEGYGRHITEIGGVPMIAMASRLPVAGGDWTLLMAVPEADFTGFIATNRRKVLWLPLAVIALVTGLATLLVIQGLRADRGSRLLLDRGGSIERQSLTFANLARQANLFDRSNEAPLQALTSALRDLAAARRTSVWKLLEGGRLLHCQDACERDLSGHVAGVHISRAELPRFFKALESGEEIRVPNAAKDKRTMGFHRALIQSIHSHGLDVVPVRGRGGVVGAIVLEDATRISDARTFAALFANVLAARMHDGADRPTTSSAAKIDTTPVMVGEQSFDAELVAHGLDKAANGVELLSSAAVMSIKFSDAGVMATRDPGGTTTLADRIAVALQEIAASYRIPYAKIVAHHVVAAAGLDVSDPTALLRIADASIAARDRCLELLEAGGHMALFRIGIACGRGVGGNVGHKPQEFNLWGEAVLAAELMAETSPEPGTIQVSEAAYHHLCPHFLLYPRGSFDLPHLGPTQTFVLGSRQ